MRKQSKICRNGNEIYQQKKLSPIATLAENITGDMVVRHSTAFAQVWKSLGGFETERERLIIREGVDQHVEVNQAIIPKDFSSLFGSSLKLRQVSAGGNNSCEWELNAANNVQFDMSRFGIEFVTSPAMPTRLSLPVRLRPIWLNRCKYATTPPLNRRTGEFPGENNINI